MIARVRNRVLPLHSTTLAPSSATVFPVSQTQCTMVTQADTNERDATEDGSREPIHVSKQAEESDRPIPREHLADTVGGGLTLVSLPESTKKDNEVDDRTLLVIFEERLYE